MEIKFIYLWKIYKQEKKARNLIMLKLYHFLFKLKKNSLAVYLIYKKIIKYIL